MKVKHFNRPQEIDSSSSDTYIHQSNIEKLLTIILNHKWNIISIIKFNKTIYNIDEDGGNYSYDVEAYEIFAYHD